MSFWRNSRTHFGHEQKKTRITPNYNNKPSHPYSLSHRNFCHHTNPFFGSHGHFRLQPPSIWFVVCIILFMYYINICKKGLIRNGVSLFLCLIRIIHLFPGCDRRHRFAQNESSFFHRAHFQSSVWFLAWHQIWILRSIGINWLRQWNSLASIVSILLHKHNRQRTVRIEKLLFANLSNSKQLLFAT